MPLMSARASRIGLLLVSASLVSISSNIASAQMPAWEPDLVPSGANAGECYARVEIPAQYSTSTENVMVEQGYAKPEVRQAKLASRQESVMVKEASVRYDVRQPSYKTVSEQMMVRPSYDKLSVSPPEFRTVTETIQTSEPRLVWKRGNPGRLAAQGYTVHSTADDRGRGYSGRSSNSSGLPASRCGETCEIWCLVEEPGQSTSFNRKVMTSPGQVRRTNVPAKYQTISKQVVADPGGVREVPIAAKYRNITVEEVVDPGGERMVSVPPKFAGVQTRSLAEPSRYEWRRAVCAPGTLNRSGASSRSGTSRSYSARTSGYTSSSSAPVTYGASSAGGATHTYNHGASNAASQSTSSQTRSTQPSVDSRTYGYTGTYYYGSDRPVQNRNSTHTSRRSSGQVSRQSTIDSGTYGYTGTYYYGTDKPVHGSGH